MIEFGPVGEEDIRAVIDTPHPVTASEFENAGVVAADLLAHLQLEDTAALACTIDGKLAFIAASFQHSEEARSTMFLAVDGVDNKKLALGARKWGREEHERFPGKHAISMSYSTHPMRDRFFAALGFKKVGEGENHVVFAD